LSAATWVTDRVARELRGSLRIPFGLPGKARRGKRRQQLVSAPPRRSKLACFDRNEPVVTDLPDVAAPCLVAWVRCVASLRRGEVRIASCWQTVKNFLHGPGTMRGPSGQLVWRAVSRRSHRLDQTLKARGLYRTSGWYDGVSARSSFDGQPSAVLGTPGMTWVPILCHGRTWWTADIRGRQAEIFIGRR